MLHLHESRAKVRDKSKTVARNSHASEILAEGWITDSPAIEKNRIKI